VRNKDISERTDMNTRTIDSIVTGHEVMEGAGVRITRILTQAQQRRLDPFLMLDVFRSDDPNDYVAGFPNHPHRGFETVTYMIAGRMRHRDNAGHEGLLQNGGIQWMTAGRGIVHSEMPEQENGTMEGFQLWLNLPAANKMAAPWYRDYQSADIPEYTTDGGVKVRVIAGESQSSRGAVTRPATEPIYLDIHLPAGARFEQTLPPTHNAFLVVYRGDVSIGGKPVRERQMAILANPPDADEVIIEAGAAAKAILVAGKPLNEPIVQHGPFVMNTQEEIVAAIRDYQAGKF
jgi:redox-sensitive bicupin YhaK (pirin superfamily)